MLTHISRLAHCKQMNHSRAFWAVRNTYAEQMRQLWARSYSGEGLWGRGALLTTGEFETNTVQAGEVLPEHLCGGTYRSQRRKRKRQVKDQLTYQQQKERRILKKFGANGVALGEDEAIKVELEKGERNASKPRVAQSKRGRELRAAAALARFNQQPKVDGDLKGEAAIKDEDETASESETASDDDTKTTAATDINGKPLLDQEGHRMIKVCEDENPDDDDAQNELRELRSSMGVSRPTLSSIPAKIPAVKKEADGRIDLPNLPDADRPMNAAAKERSNLGKKAIVIKQEYDSETAMSESAIETQSPGRCQVDKKEFSNARISRNENEHQSYAFGRGRNNIAAEMAQTHPAKNIVICPSCSTENGPMSQTCTVCLSVLDVRKDPRAWRCTSSICQDSIYLNAGIVELCGVCGRQKSAL